LGKLGDDFIPRVSASFTGEESLPERWILTKMNTAVKEVNAALEEREFAKSTQVAYRYLYDELFDIYIENSKSIISSGTPTQARSAMDTLYTALETGLRLLSPFMPFLTEELWQRLPRRPGEDFKSITIAQYPEYESAFNDAKSETAYELILGCSKGIRSLLSDYAVKNQVLVHIAPLNEESYLTAHSHLSDIQSLCGKTPIVMKIMNVGEPRPSSCADFC
jgi:valyl-tRNA synthetase